MTIFPLLHVADSVVRVTVLDGRVLLAGAMLLAFAAVAIWWPREGCVSFRRRDARGAARVAITALAFLAILPSVVPYDHLLVTAHAADESTHAAHCHGAPGDCADAPVPTGPNQILASEPLIAVPAMLSLLLLVTIVPLIGLTRRPEPRPPVRALSV